MKGLLYKDLNTLWKTYRIYLIMCAGFMVLGSVKAENIFWAVYGVFFLSTLMSSMFALDDQTHWLSYYDTLPLKRRDLVTMRYCLNLVLTLCMAVVYFILSLILRVNDLPTTIATMGTMLMMSMLASAISLPINIRYGSVKGQMVRMLVLMITIFLGMLIITQAQGIILLAASLNMSVILPVCVIGVLLIYLLSWRLSVKFLEEKEF